MYLRSGKKLKDTMNTSQETQTLPPNTDATELAINSVTVSSPQTLTNVTSSDNINVTNSFSQTIAPHVSSTSYVREVECNEKEFIISYNPDLNMKFQNWLTYFEKTCAKLNKTEQWKIQNISKYLGGSALTEFVNTAHNLNTWPEIVEALKEKYFACSSFSFADFTSLKLENDSDLVSYFHKKLELGRDLHLSNDLILEGLTNGLPYNIQTLLTIQPPKTATEWLEIVSKLIKIPKVTERTHSSSAPNYSRSYVTAPRPFTPRYQNPRMTYFTNRSGNFNHTRMPGNTWPRFDRFRAPYQNIHYQQNVNLPRTPCRNCERYGVPHAYHWANTCPFRFNTNATTPINQSLPLNRSTQERSDHVGDNVENQQ